MLKYACVLLLGAVLLVLAEEPIEIVNRPLETYTEMEYQEPNFVFRPKSIPESPRNTVLLTGIGGLIRLYKFYIEAGGVFLKNVIAELKALPKKTYGVNVRLFTYQELLESLHFLAGADNDTLNIDALMTDSDAIDKILFEYDNIPANADEVTLAKAFEKCDYAALDAAYRKEILLFTERFMKTVDAYAATLDARKKEEDRNLLSWYERYTAEKDLEQRISTFSELFYYFTEEDTTVKTEIHIHNLE